MRGLSRTKNSMLEKLTAIDERFEELNHQLEEHAEDYQKVAEYLLDEKAFESTARTIEQQHVEETTEEIKRVRTVSPPIDIQSVSAAEPKEQRTESPQISSD